MRKYIFSIALIVLAAALLIPAPRAQSRALSLHPSVPASVPGAWETTWRGTGSIRDLACRSSQTCLAVGSAGMLLETQNAGVTWRYRSLITPTDFLGLALNAGGQGIIVGQSGTVFYSGDGGQTWSQATAITSADLTAVSLLDGGLAWATGADGSIWFSANGGQNWSSQQSGVSTALHDILFVNAQTGYAVGAKGVGLRSSDGGVTWTPMTTTFPAWAGIYAVSFSDASHGWIGGQVGMLRQTSDGGATWQAVVSGLEANSIDILSLHMLPGFGVLGGGNGIIATTTDGNTWTIQTDVGTNTRDVQKVLALSANDVWAAGAVKPAPDSGDRGWWITQSSDGVHFSRRAGDFGLTPHLYAAAFPSKDVGYVVGESSALGKTTDGGLTWAWQKVETGTTDQHRWWSISCPDSEHCWLSGRYGTIYATADGGQSWQRQSVAGYGKPFYAINMVDLDTGFLGAATGVPNMYRSANGGQTWEGSISDGTSVNVAISMLDANTGWTALRNFSYRWTTNGGQTWRRVIDSTMSQGIYIDLQILDADQNGQVDQAWFVGCRGPLVDEECPTPEEGVIAHTADGSALDTTTTWEYQNLPADTPPLEGIEMLDAQHGWVVGRDNTILYTDDGGAIWQKAAVEAPASSHLMDLAFADNTHGLTVGNDGAILRYLSPGRTLGSYQQDLLPPVIDGQVGDWYLGGELLLDANNAGAVLGHPVPPTITDLSASISSRWTTDTLYLLAEITDTQGITLTSDALWVALDGSDDNVWPGADDHLLRIGIDGVVTDTLHPAQTAFVSAAVQVHAQGWTVELGAPAVLLGRSSFAAGDSVGFNLAIEDDDGSGIEHTLVLENRRVDANPATFGSIRLIANTLSYQNGVDAYAGNTDTFLERWYDQTGNTPHGNEDTFYVIYNIGQVFADALLRFDLPLLPPGAQIDAATLQLHVNSSRVDSPLTISAYQLLRPWNEKTATWNEADTGQPWQDGGARWAGADRADTAADTVVLTEAIRNAPLQWDLTAAVQGWVADPASNHGVLLLPEDGARQIWVRSSEYADISTRPQLSVQFHLQPPPATLTPTPTATASPSPTPSPTPTLTPTPTASPTATATPTPVPARISGRVFVDANANGQYDAGESGLAGATVFLHTAIETRQQTTVTSGAYAFESLAAGEYDLDIVPPAGYGPAQPQTPLHLMLHAGDVLELNFGYQPLPTPTPTSQPLYLPMVVRP